MKQFSECGYLESIKQLPIGEVTPGVLYLGLCSSVHERHGHTGDSLMKGHKYDEGN